MSRIVIVAKSSRSELVSELRKLLPQSGIFDIKDALATGAPLMDREVFNDDFAEAHEQVRGVVALLKRNGVPFQVYELQEGQTVKSSPHNLIDESTLENILSSFPNEAGAV